MTAVGTATGTPVRGRGFAHVAALAGYALLTVVMTWPLAANVTTAIPGDSFDGWQNYWNLWWMKVALVDRAQNPLFTDMLYAPTGVGLYFHTLNPFNGLISLPIQLTGGLILAYNFVIFFSWVLSGYGVFLLTRWVLAQAVQAGASGFAADGAAFLAGAIFTFSPFHMAHLLGHMQVLSLEWIPFYVLYLLRATAAALGGRRWRRDALLAGLFLVFVGLCDWYFVLYLFFFTALALAWFGARELRRGRTAGRNHLVRRLGRLIAPALVAAALFLLLLSPMLVPMVGEATRFSFMVRPPTDLYILSASVMDFLVPNRLHTLFRPESFGWIGNQIAPVSERTIAVGYLALVLAGVGVWRGRGRTGFWALIALFFVLMALGPRVNWGNITWDEIPSDVTDASSWTLFGVLNEFVPFMRISRSVSRYAVMVQFAVAVLAGVGAYTIMARWRRGFIRMLVGSALLAVVLAEYWVAPYPLSPPDTPEFYATLATQPGEGAILNLPMNYDRPGYLLYQTVHGRPLTVAYISRDDPRTLTTRVPLLQHLRHLGPDIVVADVGRVGRTVLNDLGVEFVVLDRYKMPGSDERVITEELAATVFGESAPVHEDERITVYRVNPVSTPVPYVELGAIGWGPLERDGDMRSRQLVGASAALHLHHLSQDDRVELVLRYRTVANAALSVAGTDVPAAPDGRSVTLSLRPETVAAGVVELASSVPDAVWIESVELRVAR